MTALARQGDQCTGHPCHSPVPYIIGSTDVLINSKPALRQTDSHAVHCCGPKCHDGFVSKGSTTVFINGLGAARQGDPNSCSPLNFVDISSSDSFAGG